MIEEILPSIRKALFNEDKLFKRKIHSSIHTDFYLEDVKGIASYILTERTLQYVIFRELCKTYKIFPEDLAYLNSKERMDLSIYKNTKDLSKFAEIGIELKQVSFRNDGNLYKNGLDSLISDFEKIKRAGNRNKYIILFGLHNKKCIEIEGFNKFLSKSIDNRKFKKFGLSLINQVSFKTDGYNERNYYLINLLKVK